MKTWTITLPPPRITAQAFLRIINAYIRCPYCDSKRVDLVLERADTQGTSTAL